MAKHGNMHYLQTTQNGRQTPDTVPLQTEKPRYTSLLQNKNFAVPKLPRGTHSKGINSLEEARSKFTASQLRKKKLSLLFCGGVKQQKKFLLCMDGSTITLF